MRPLRKDRLTLLEEHEQVGRAVEVDIHDGTRMLARRRVEFLDEIDTVVKVAIRLASYDLATFVVLVHIRSAVEVRIESHFGELAQMIVDVPHIGPSVAVPILCANVAGGMPQAMSDRCNPSRPVPVMVIHGTEDPIVPWKGGAVAGFDEFATALVFACPISRRVTG